MRRREFVAISAVALVAGCQSDDGPATAPTETATPTATESPTTTATRTRTDTPTRARSRDPARIRAEHLDDARESIGVAGSELRTQVDRLRLERWRWDPDAIEPVLERSDVSKVYYHAGP